jgi:tRNA(Ile)-lysidine synthase
MVRGTGLAGLVGIPEQRDRYVRPLLIFRREETRAFCRERGLWFHDDPSNDDLDFSRARLRQRVVPELELVHPGAIDSIVRLSKMAGEDNEILDTVAANSMGAHEIHPNGILTFLTEAQESFFRIEGLMSLPPALVRRGLRLVVRYLGREASFDWLDQLWNQARTEPKGSRTANGEVIAEWSDGVLHLRVAQTEEVARYPLAYPGDLESDVFGWALRLSEAEQEASSSSPLEAILDRKKLAGNLFIRSAQEGDRFDLLGLGGTKLVSDLFRDRGLTPLARKRLPLVCDMAGIVWVPGCGLSERVRADKDSVTKLRVLFEPLFKAES